MLADQVKPGTDDVNMESGVASDSSSNSSPAELSEIRRLINSRNIEPLFPKHHPKFAESKVVNKVAKIEWEERKMSLGFT
ncbi:hypothetical protein OnM2_012023 [Erysiphe neolycopersici]|uniref:Uncharacterized protein n=1 Tax=Erysiphe neolycopersici TaxID=212602 RepID=A0A420I655_9PEZI|nr:hypothetical protein OnM2_012023 [Erysiphe neolycopersici]